MFNLVSNWAYTRWDAIYPDVLSEILTHEKEYFALVEETDRKALVLLSHDSSIAQGVEYLTKVTESVGEALLADWVSFFGRLFVKYRDGYVTTAKSSVTAPVCGCDTSSLPYQDAWYNRIVADTGDVYKVGGWVLLIIIIFAIIFLFIFILLFI